jgi:hypothetical protein
MPHSFLQFALAIQRQSSYHIHDVIWLWEIITRRVCFYEQFIAREVFSAFLFPQQTRRGGGVTPGSTIVLHINIDVCSFGLIAW